jgi:hypothetical protein
VTRTSNVTFSHAMGSCMSTSVMSWEKRFVIDPMSYVELLSVCVVEV